MSRFITYLPLDAPGALTAGDTIAALKATIGEAPMRIEEHGPVDDAHGTGFIISVNGMAVVVLFMAVPLPEDAWQEAAAASLTWRDAAETLRRTRAHVVLSLLENPPEHPHALNGAVAVTLLAAAIARRLSVAAIVFTESHAIAPGDALGDIATSVAEQGQMPVMLWTRLAFLRGPEAADGRPTVGALTVGLAAFIGREIELEPAPLEPSGVAERLLGLCQYLIVNGPIIGDGETVGLTEAETIRVRWADQGTRPGVPVLLMRLEMADPTLAAPVRHPRRGGNTPPARPARKAFGRRKT